MIAFFVLFLLIDKAPCNSFPILSVQHMARRSSATAESRMFARDVTTRRWNGNSKPRTERLQDIPTAKKHTLVLTSAQGDTKTFAKKRGETLQHVLTKAILWSLYQDMHPGILIEHQLQGSDYLPDCVCLDEENRVLFWGESGRMSVQKAVDLAERYPDTHLVHLRWAVPVEEFAPEIIRNIKAREILRSGKFEFASIPNDVWRFVDENNKIKIDRNDLKWMEL
jgi:hypothetical protein